MISALLPDETIIALLIITAIIAIVLLKIRSAQRKKALEHLRASQQQSRRALLLFVMLNHQCSEEAAYQRIATFVKKYVPLEEQSSIERMLAQDRPGLLDRTRDILAQNPHEIDKI
jgi:hypothetical protein